jgi:KaiC/GvpD/RAD55 family RecA-like ATPase
MPTSRNSFDSLVGVLFYAGLPVALLGLVAGFVTMRKHGKSGQKGVLSKNGPESPDFPLFGFAAGRVLPDAFSTMIIGEARSEKGLFCEQLANYYLRQEKPVVYVTYDRFPDEVRKDMENMGWDISKDEQMSNFVFVDAYSSIAGRQSSESHFVKQPFSLSELGIALSSALNSFHGKSAKVFLVSTGPLFTRLDSSKVVEFLQDRSALIKGENAMFFFTVGKGTIQENHQRRLEEMVDCLVDLDVREGKGKSDRIMFVKKLRGKSCTNLEFVLNYPEAVSVSGVAAREVKN